MAIETSVTKYQSRDGQEITLSFQSIKNYLVSGNREKVTDQELVYFMAICKSRGLNPFKKDAYLIKYGDDPAAIVTSIDYFRSRARAQKDCVGWKKGIIVKTKDGQVRDSAGLIQDGDVLLGGFFEATPAGWKEPFRLEVNLKGYIKKTKDGRITKFWSEDNQPSQIAKVAESQGLRTLWPDEFQGIYEETELKVNSDIEMTAGANGAYEKKDPEPDTTHFGALVKEKVYKPEKLAEFIALSAKAQGGKTDNQIKALAQDHFEDFWQQFMAWQLKNEKKSVKKPKPEPDKAENGADRKHCPNLETSVAIKACETCRTRKGCPAWEAEDGQTTEEREPGIDG
jgi:phage recombination protein Bet